MTDLKTLLDDWLDEETLPATGDAERVDDAIRRGQGLRRRRRLAWTEAAAIAVASVVVAAVAITSAPVTRTAVPADPPSPSAAPSPTAGTSSPTSTASPSPTRTPSAPTARRMTVRYKLGDVLGDGRVVKVTWPEPASGLPWTDAAVESSRPGPAGERLAVALRATAPGGRHDRVYDRRDVELGPDGSVRTVAASAQGRAGLAGLTEVAMTRGGAMGIRGSPNVWDPCGDWPGYGVGLDRYHPANYEFIGPGRCTVARTSNGTLVHFLAGSANVWLRETFTVRADGTAVLVRTEGSGPAPDDARATWALLDKLALELAYPVR